MKFKKITAVIITSVALTGAAHAAIPGAYVGGGIGYSSLENFTDATKKGDGGTGGQIIAGYNFNKYLGVEAGYRVYADTTYHIDGYDYLTFDYNMRSINLVGKGYLPFSEDGPFNLYILLGVSKVYGKGDIKLDSNKLESNSNSALLATAGLGASYSFRSHITTSIEYSHTGGKSGDENNIGIPESNLATLNIAYNF